VAQIFSDILGNFGIKRLEFQDLGIFECPRFARTFERLGAKKLEI
jgi:hypothetical protein